MSEDIGVITKCYTVTFERTSKHAASRLWGAITNPDDVKRVLVSNHKNYTKGSLLDRVKILLGNGIISLIVLHVFHGFA